MRIKSFLESEYVHLFMPRQKLGQKPIRKCDDPLSRSARLSFSLLHRNLAEIAVFKSERKPSLQELYPVAYRCEDCLRRRLRSYAGHIWNSQWDPLRWRFGWIKYNPRSKILYIVLAKYHISYECLKCKRTRKNKSKNQSKVKGERNCAIFSSSGKNHRRFQFIRFYFAVLWL